MAICRCSRSLSQNDSAPSRMIGEAGMEMSNGVGRMGFMAFVGVPPPCDNADRLSVRPGLDRGSPAGWMSLLSFAPEAAPRLERPTLHPMGRSVHPKAGRAETATGP